MDFEQSQTKTNLARAFAGECQAGARYQFVAQKAMQQGKKNVQNLLKGLAKNEMSHARTFWNQIAQNSKEIQRNIEIRGGYPFEEAEMVDMLKYAANTEKSENSSIYPSFSKIAEDEGFKSVAQKFKMVALVENDHYMVLESLYNKIKSNSLYKSSVPQEWKCIQCGYIGKGKEGWTKCPLCEATQDYIDLAFLSNS